MDTVLAQTLGNQPEQVAQTPVPQDAQPSPEPTHLDQQGEQQAPAPTSVDEGQASASAEAPQFSYEEYVQLREQHEQAQKTLQENDQVLGELKRLAAEQQAAQANQKVRSEIQQEVNKFLQKAGVEDDETAAAIAESVFGRFDTTRSAFQQQMESYQQEVDDYYKNAMWAGTRENYADYAIREFDLDPAVRPRLLQSQSEEEMTQTAKTLKEAKDFYQKRALETRVQEQEQQRRASGVDTITGTNSGPLTSEPLKPGRNLDVLSAILNGA